MSEEGAVRWLLTLSALTIAIVALILSNVFTERRNGEITILRATTAELAANGTHRDMQIAMLRSEWVEIMMHLANETVLGNGTFVWALSADTDQPAGICTSAPTGYTQVGAGTGYRVGDLITLPHNYLTVTFARSPIFRVDSVGLAGDVLTFTTLSRGCNGFGPLSTAIPGISIVGTGFSVTMNSNFGLVTDPYYAFPSPPNQLVAPLQVSTWTLKQVTIESVAFNVLVLDPPAVPMVSGYEGIGNVVTSEFLHVTTFGWQPEVTAVTSLGRSGYVFPFTQKNMAAVSLVDDSSCWSLPFAGDCFMDADQNDYGGYLNSAGFETFQTGNNLQMRSSYAFWYFNSYYTHPHDFLANHANFTLTSPLMWVLPAL